VLFAFGFGMLAFAKSPWIFFASTVVWTLGEIVNATNEPAYVANHTPMSHRGRFAAVLPIVGGVGYSISGPIGGRVLEASGTGAMWLLSALVALAASAGLYLLAAAERRAAARKGAAATGSPEPAEPVRSTEGAATP
jgi:MFS family permease